MVPWSWWHQGFTLATSKQELITIACSELVLWQSVQLAPNLELPLAFIIISACRTMVSAPCCPSWILHVTSYISNDKEVLCWSIAKALELCSLARPVARCPSNFHSDLKAFELHLAEQTAQAAQAAQQAGAILESSELETDPTEIHPQHAWESIARASHEHWEGPG
mmetsp:Transcript_45613/g.75006  ORF Transcript_45613/g.75006 Transcript_45613/m.75006 type:complete len:166 (-) Transcript_45613:326-823(-)